LASHPHGEHAALEIASWQILPSVPLAFVIITTKKEGAPSVPSVCDTVSKFDIPFFLFSSFFYLFWEATWATCITPVCSGALSAGKRRLSSQEALLAHIRYKHSMSLDTL
jgi:hypothetical protein